MVEQIISPPIKLFTLTEIFLCEQKSNKILTWYGRRHDKFWANRPLTGVTITFIRCLYRVTGVSIGQGVIRHHRNQKKNKKKQIILTTMCLTCHRVLYNR